MIGERVPDPLPETRLRPRGSNQGGMRQFNERVVLQAIRLQGSCPKAEIARLTHLTAQTVQIIIARLEADELVRKLPPVRGKVGQPSVPMALNPDGAFSIGVKIGRRSMDMLLVDFTGQVRERLSLDYPFPDPDTLFAEVGTRLRQLRKALKPALRERLHGIGVAAPLSLGGWNELLGIAPELAAKWHGIDMRERMAVLGATAGLPIEFVKDTAAACVAELVAGRGRSIRSFLYVFVDTFIGGGLVLDSHLSGGVTGNAGAVGSLPMGLGNRAARPPEQLLNVASLWNLEALYAKAGIDVNAWTDARALAEPWLPSTRAWLGEAGPAIALAINSAACLLDLEGVIIDGSFGRELLRSLMPEVESALDRYSWEGVARPRVLAGTIGSDARAIGGALLPLYANFAPDRDLFLKIDKMNGAAR
jgi:predicted NBD/HSP70 family sugar kinase